MRCSVCADAQVKTVDKLLGTGSSVRQVARITGIPRTTLARHREHSQVRGRKLALIRNDGGPEGPGGPLDPLAEALELSRRARTERQALRAAEAVRAATALKVRAFRGGDLDQDMLEQLDHNLAAAEALYRQVGGSFENELRGLQGVREAIRQRLEAVKAGGTVEVPLVVLAGDEPLPLPPTLSPPKPMKLTLDQYFRGVPSRFRDPERYVVQHTIRIYIDAPSQEEIKVFEGDVLVWAKP